MSLKKAATHQITMYRRSFIYFGKLLKKNTVVNYLVAEKYQHFRILKGDELGKKCTCHVSEIHNRNLGIRLDEQR